MPELPTIEGFRILEEIGSGTMCLVYAAVDEGIGRRVAIKSLRSTIQPTSPLATYLEREARVLAELGHPNIGMLYAFSKTNERMYLVLELVDGFSLSTVTKSKKTMAPEGVAALGAAVARGLQHVHEHAFVHRDIKPANILVSQHGEVKIFDFGIAARVRVATEPVPLSLGSYDEAGAFGTPAYMSPEQILGEAVDARSDVFSLGIVLYQLASGARPFDRLDEDDERPAAHRIRRDPPIPLHRRAPEVPPPLERIIMRAVEKLPADRFQTARELAEELEELVGNGCGLRGDLRIVNALELAGLVSPSVEPISPGRIVRAKDRDPLRTALVGMAILGAAGLGAAMLLQSGAPRHETGTGVLPLELVPARPGYLRVLATPWAEVWIDGERVDVTPFARAIALRPGTHYLTFVHPAAPTEKRTIAIISGETKTVDVVMSVAKPSSKEAYEGKSTGERESKR